MPNALQAFSRQVTFSFIELRFAFARVAQGSCTRLVGRAHAHAMRENGGGTARHGCEARLGQARGSRHRLALHIMRQRRRWRGWPLCCGDVLKALKHASIRGNGATPGRTNRPAGIDRHNQESHHDGHVLCRSGGLKSDLYDTFPKVKSAIRDSREQMRHKSAPMENDGLEYPAEEHEGN